MSLASSPHRNSRAALARGWALLALMSLAAAGCASTAASAPASPRLGLVTGSSIPRAVNAHGAPVTPTEDLRVYSRADLEGTGQIGNLGAALATLDPSVTAH